MTTTDTEAKALALELLNTVRDSRGLPTATMEDAHGFAWFDALCRAIEREAATEARHAAELREQAERFSEAVKRLPKHVQHNFRLTPFILPAPDPLVEAWVEATGNTVGMGPLNEALAKRGGKIVWEAGE